MKKIFACVLSLSFFLLCTNGWSRPLAVDYKTDAIATCKIGVDLWQALKRSDRHLFSPECVILGEDNEPLVAPITFREGAGSERGIAISQGFVDLVNNVSHAKAIDKVEPGYLKNYLSELAKESGTLPLRPIPGVEQSKYWSVEIINEQQSNFNQMVALLLAMQLSHHVLGHYDSHVVDLKAGTEMQPINQFLTAREWNDSFHAGLTISLAAGYGVEGFEALCEALRRMPQHPRWTMFFLPKGINYLQLTQELERSEKAFFKVF